MGNVFNQWWDFIYNALVYAVSLQWSRLVQIGVDIRTWWDNFWVYIVNLVQSVEDQLWAVRQILSDRIWAIYPWALDLFTQAEAYMLAQVQAVIDWVQVTLADLSDYVAPVIDSVKAWVLDLLQTWLDAALAFISPYIEAVEIWVQDTFGWLLDSYTLLTIWLGTVRDAVTWLASYAWTMLTSFLTDPWGFVLGQLGATIINVVNWYLMWSVPLSDFLTQDLPGLRNFMAMGLDFLLAFMNSPLQTILDLLYPVFLDWLEQLIADAW